MWGPGPLPLLLIAIASMRYFEKLNGGNKLMIYESLKTRFRTDFTLYTHHVLTRNCVIALPKLPFIVARRNKMSWRR